MGNNQELEKVIKKKSKSKKVYLTSKQLKYVHEKVCAGDEIAIEVLWKFVWTQIQTAKYFFNFNIRQYEYFIGEVYRKILYVCENYKPGNVNLELFRIIIWQESPASVFLRKDLCRYEVPFDKYFDDSDKHNQENDGSQFDDLIDKFDLRDDFICFEQKKVVREEIRKLDKEQQVVIFGRFWDERSYQYLSKQLRYNSPNTAKNKFDKAKEILTQRFLEIDKSGADYLETDEWNV